HARNTGVTYNNGRTRPLAAGKSAPGMTAPPQPTYFSLQPGDLPIRQSVQDAPGFLQQMDQGLPGVDTFVTNLGNVKQARPQLPTYPKISTILGQMIVSVLLGKAQPQAPLASAAH